MAVKKSEETIEEDINVVDIKELGEVVDANVWK